MSSQQGGESSEHNLIMRDTDTKQDGHCTTDAIIQQILELEETVKAMRATLFLVCRGRVLEKQIG